jgi:DNA-binding MarR family transcriptional regulator
MTAAAVPPTTALRHMKSLCAAGRVTHNTDPHDGRRSCVCMGSEAFNRLDEFLQKSVTNMSRWG